MLQDFSRFFHALWGYDPFPWQAALAERACAGKWPDYLAAPTGSGKTACIDIAVFALAVQAALPVEQRTVGRRIFFIVNRRVIVDEAYERAQTIAERLANSRDEEPIVRQAAEALRSLSPAGRPDVPPLDCVQLRGAIYRDNRWARSLTQPTIIASTVDQVGSRLLFRGYGLSPGACPLHAALVANDSLLLSDEAHISRPFAQTLNWVRRFRRHSADGAEESVSLRTPFHFVQMTATPPAEAEKDAVLRLDETDRTHRVLAPRLGKAKRARLVVAEKVKGRKAPRFLADALFEAACKILEEHQPASLAVMVNRVATARNVAGLLQKKFGEDRISLMIGRMRPVDRDEVTAEVSKHLKTGRAETRDEDDREAGSRPLIVVATQCLEVGADLDFDALVTECAGLDALRQRFGRLNRAGRDIDPAALVLMRGDLVEPSDKKLAEADAKGKPLDPVYGNAASRTWNWLQSIAEDDQVDFGVNAMGAAVEKLSREEVSRLFSPTRDAPVLFPAYLDAWVQTNPRPAPDPDPALFLHGPDAGQPEVQVCWRADLPDRDDKNAWTQAVSLCPPSTPEVLSVPIGLFRDWFFQKPQIDDPGSDLLSQRSSVDEDARGEEQAPRARALVWRGLRESAFVKQPADLRPGDTVVLPVSAGGWATLGHVPGSPNDPADPDATKETPAASSLASIDIGNAAFRKSRDREIVRLRNDLVPDPESCEGLGELMAWAMDGESDWTKREVRECLREVAACGELPPEFRQSVAELVAGDFTYTRYGDDRGVVLVSRRRLGKTRTSLISLGDEDEVLSAMDEPVSLADHLAHVVERIDAALAHLPLAKHREALLAAARLHDWGKLDERFQALLLRGDPNAALALREPLAKSPALSLTARERLLARLRCGLPERFRHEMLSVQLAETDAGKQQMPEESDLGALALHLIASHHGHARPFAPVVIDTDPPPVEPVDLDGTETPALSGAERLARPPHRLDSGIPERFWQLTRRHGWWGLAYLEAALRLADQQASEDEATGNLWSPTETQPEPASV